MSAAIFLGSYLPLAVILLAQDFEYTLLRRDVCWHIGGANPSCVIPLAHPWLSLSMVGICFVSFCLSLLALSLSRPNISVDVTEVRYIPAELMNYTLPYIVTFMGIGYQETGKIVGLTIFLVWMFWITHKSGQIILNPLLAVLGWRLYEVKYVFPGDLTVNNGRALARGIIEPGHRYPHIVVQDIVILRAVHS